MHLCGGDGAPAVVLARADDFADAQSGAPLAVRAGAPMLLTQPDQLHPDPLAEIRRILFVFSGPDVVSEDSVAEIERIFD